MSLKNIFEMYCKLYDFDPDEVYFRMNFDMELLMNNGESQTNGTCCRVEWTNRAQGELKDRIVSLWLLMSSEERQELFENVRGLNVTLDNKKSR